MRKSIRQPEQREEPAHVQVAAAPPGILALQRSAGNRAVSAWLARQPAPVDLRHAGDAKDEIARLAGKPAPAVEERNLNVPEAAKWLTDVSDSLSCLTQEAVASSDKTPAVELAARTFGTRLRDAIVAAMNHSSVVDHATSPELGALSDAVTLRNAATQLALVDRFQAAAQACEDAALALLQARSVSEARETWRAGNLSSTDPAHVEDAHRARTEVDDVFVDAGWDNNGQTLKSPTKEDDWCGMFASANLFRGAAFDKQLRAAFSHTNDVSNFFHYAAVESDRTPVSIWADGQWWDLQAYHASRGLPRTYVEGPDAAADIRPGDIVLIRHAGTQPAGAVADHIAMVESYDAATGTLTTVEGNVTTGIKPGADGRAERTASGDLKFSRVGVDHSTSMIEQRNMNDATAVDTTTSMVKGPHDAYQTSGRNSVWLVGRPSLIDFEQHDYAKKPVPERWKHRSPQEMRSHADSKGSMQRRFPYESSQQTDSPYHARVGR